MAVQHIVIIKFRDGVTPERIEWHLAGLRSLKDRVPGIRDLSVGANFTDRAAGHTHGVVVTLDDRAALPQYISHPAHVEVATALRAESDYLVMDYEF